MNIHARKITQNFLAAGAVAVMMYAAVLGAGTWIGLVRWHWPLW